MKRGPKKIAVIAEVAAFLLAATLAVAPAAAQQVTGVLGSPSATTDAASFSKSTDIYQLGKNGLIAQVTVAGTKFWKDKALN